MGYFQCRSPPRQMASDGGEKMFDPVLFDVTRIPADDIATQITKEDFEVFQNIRPDELTCVGWSGRNKQELSPNVVEMTQRFNRTSFWAISVILQTQNLKLRVEVLTQFIRIARRLHDFSNYHGMLAIISALRHVAIDRLTDTWSRISRADRKHFEVLSKFVPEGDGHQLLREKFEAIQLPCIPHLGLFLKELTYIDVANPIVNGIEPESRVMKMNNILRLISEFQMSDYSDLPSLPYIQSYLKSFDYISELQRFLEDDNYKQSYELQPKFDKKSKKFGTMDDLNNPAPRNSVTSRFTRGHRRTVSLGRSPRHNHELLSTEHQPTVSLLDDHPLSQSSSPGSINGVRNSLPGNGISYDIPPEAIIQEGCLMRKKNAKKGQKMAIKYWKRYWIVLTNASGNGYGNDNVLLLYESRSPFIFSRIVDRRQFHRDSAKQMVLSHFVFSEECPNADEFSLTDEYSGECYRFKAFGAVNAHMWKAAIAEAKRPKIPDLIDLSEDR
ncbi:Oidioi.mRNA.OKI2018_I69.PAR.g10958.t1.cds [Oikopleura dioica]|uniref:Oidioi.mRNA.OKI2018_I69.PAR.g10958.t1.cds n=1 Tax=Oikopleura dioica TaxID=34765 RepID=A0ABN7RTC5_OIKDI|nr:Oidioi.mRNA.OKI2018_I69.PAR.g10958.t1.cds [Oikopleura dioica]